MTGHLQPTFAPQALDRARAEPARLGRGHQNLWEEMRQVLLDPEPDPQQLEVVRRWLRDDVECELHARLDRGNASGLVQWACRLAPRLIWSLPFSRASPQKRYHRRIVAILLPPKLRQVEQQLAVCAFREGLS